MIRTLRNWFVVIVCGAATTSHACDCIQQVPPSEEYAAAHAVFSGRVISVDTNAQLLQVTFERFTSWKGAVSANVVVRTAISSAMCGAFFQVDSTYLIYAWSMGGDSLATTMCSRTARLADAKEDLDYLATTSVESGRPEHPTPGAIALSAAYPSPLVSRATFHFSLPEAADARVAVFNMRGEQVAVLLHERLLPGAHDAVWSASGVVPGAYVVTAEAGGNRVYRMIVVQ